MKARSRVVVLVVALLVCSGPAWAQSGQAEHGDLWSSWSTWAEQVVAWMSGLLTGGQEENPELEGSSSAVELPGGTTTLNGGATCTQPPGWEGGACDPNG
jgi:hypothetical protein